MRTYFAILVFALAAGAQQPTPASLAQQELPGLVATYKQIHEAPELSHQEAKTSALVAGQLRAMGYTVTDHVGKYAGHPEWTGYGVVAIFKNGPGPTLLVRSELDALPVTEVTPLPWASHVIAKDDSGQTVGVMHACGHDIHMTVLLGTAAALMRLKSEWHGTLELIGQPAEETINGAKAMLDDGLYTRFPKPDMAIALHDNAELAAGKLGYTPGFAMASATSVKVTLHGVSAHGSLPEDSKDPVVAAAELVLALQAIVSRETSPFDQAVVTVGSIQAGTKNNIIPATATLLLSVRTYQEAVRQRILASIERMADGIAVADGLPKDQPPQVETYEYTPALYNDPALAQRLSAVLTRTFGAANVEKLPPIMASEDFGYLGLQASNDPRKIPVFFYSLGAVDPAKVAASQRTGVPLPSLHSNLFEPQPAPTIQTGVTAMTTLVLNLLGGH